MENKYSKPGYDGRLKYYEHLKSYWDRLADTTFNDDYMMKKKALRGYFSRTKAFIREKDCNIIYEMFKKVDNMILQISSFSINNREIVVNKIIIELQDIEDLLFVATKDMLVSTKEDGEDETFDIEKFMKESD